jgi:hypothetical protein
VPRLVHHHVGLGDEHLVEEAGAVQGAQHGLPALAVEVAHPAVGEERGVGAPEDGGVFQAVDAQLGGAGLEAARSEGRGAPIGGEHDGLDIGRVEDGQARVEAAAERVHDVPRLGRQAVGVAEAVEGRHGRLARLLRGLDQPGLLPQGLGADGDVAEAAQVAHVAAVRDALVAAVVLAEDRHHRVVVGTRALPRHHPVGGGDHHPEDPRPVGPRGREADRLEPVGVGRGATEGEAVFLLQVPVDPGAHGSASPASPLPSACGAGRSW